MKVRCKNGHIWDVKYTWEEVLNEIKENPEPRKVSDIRCPECKEYQYPIAEIKVTEEKVMGNHQTGRKISKID
jgi:hypothetical protein